MGRPSKKPKAQTHHLLLLSPSQHYSSGMERENRHFHLCYHFTFFHSCALLNFLSENFLSHFLVVVPTNVTVNSDHFKQPWPSFIQRHYFSSTGSVSGYLSLFKTTDLTFI